MDIKDIVVGQFVVATHTVGSDNLADTLFFDEPVLEIGTAYKVIQVDTAFAGDTQPICIALPSGVGSDPSGWWCHPKYFTAQESK